MLQKKGWKFIITNTLHYSHIRSQCLTTRICSSSPNLWLHILFHYSGSTASLKCHPKAFTFFIYISRRRCRSTYHFPGTTTILLFTDYSSPQSLMLLVIVGIVKSATWVPQPRRYHNLMPCLITKDSPQGHLLQENILFSMISNKSYYTLKPIPQESMLNYR